MLILVWLWALRGSGFSLLIMVQLRGFGNSLHHQLWLSSYIGLCSVIILEKGFPLQTGVESRMCVCVLQQMTIMVYGQV